MTTTQSVKTSGTINNKSPIQDYIHPGDHTQPTYEMIPGFKPLTVILNCVSHEPAQDNSEQHYRTPQHDTCISAVLPCTPSLPLLPSSWHLQVLPDTTKVPPQMDCLSVGDGRFPPQSLFSHMLSPTQLDSCKVAGKH